MILTKRNRIESGYGFSIRFLSNPASFINLFHIFFQNSKTLDKFLKYVIILNTR